MFQETEIINLIIGVLSLIIFIYKRNDFPRYPLIYYGFFSIIGALVFTVIEGIKYVWADVHPVQRWHGHMNMPRLHQRPEVP